MIIPKPNFRHQALKTIHPNIQSTETPQGGETTAWDINGVVIELDDSAIATEVATLDAEWDAQEYARNRKAEYPDTGTQFNKIYDDGIDAWKADMVDPIKAKYPKP